MNYPSRSTDIDWEIIGEKNPFWGVISSDEYYNLDITNQDLINKFYSSGDVYVENLLNWIRVRINPNFKLNNVLDFGSGVGRLLLPFAKRSPSVCYGCDVSSGMHEKCEIRSKQTNIRNIKLIKNLDEIGIKFNLVNTYIVLQHIPTHIGMKYISKMLNLVENNGLISFQFTIAREKSLWGHDVKDYFVNDGDKLHSLFKNYDFDERPEGTVTMYDYSLTEIIILLKINNFSNINLETTNHGGHIGVHILSQKV